MLPLDLKQRSLVFWTVTVVLLCLGAWGTKYLYYDTISPLWVDHAITIRRWLQNNTPLKGIINVRIAIFLLDVPYIGMGFIAGMGIAYFFRRYWLRLVLVFGLTYTLIKQVQELVIWYEYFYSSMGHPTISSETIQFLYILAGPIAGGFIITRIFRVNKIDPTQCRKCGYLLKGLTVNRCPECGTEFDPQLLADQQTDVQIPSENAGKQTGVGQD